MRFELRISRKTVIPLRKWKRRIRSRRSHRARLRHQVHGRRKVYRMHSLPRRSMSPTDDGSSASRTETPRTQIIGERYDRMATLNTQILTVR